MATIEVKARRGHYVARLDGSATKFGLEREFCDGQKIKSRRTYKHELGPGFYEIQTVLPVAERPAPCSECGSRSDGKIREYFAVTTGDAIEDLTEWAGEIDKISAGPPLDGPYHPPPEREEDHDCDGPARCEDASHLPVPV